MLTKTKLWRVFFRGLALAGVCVAFARPAVGDQDLKKAIDQTFSHANSAEVQFSGLEIELTTNPVDRSLIGIVTGVLAGEACGCKTAGMPLLSKIPYIGRALQNVGQTPSCDSCEIEIAGSNVLPAQAPLVAVCDAWQSIAQCSTNQPCGTRSCDAKRCQVVAHCDLPQNKTAQQCKPCAISKPEKAKSAKSRDKKSAKIDEQMLQLVAENAALQARMETRDELIEEFLPLLEENARLKAMAEFNERREEIIGQYFESQRQHASAIADVSIENARLKAQIEAAAAQQDVMSEFINTHKHYAQKLAELHQHARPVPHTEYADPARAEIERLRRHAAMLEAKVRELTHAAQLPKYPAQAPYTSGNQQPNYTQPNYGPNDPYADYRSPHGNTRITPPATGAWVSPPATASEPQRHNPPAQ